MHLCIAKNEIISEKGDAAYVSVKPPLTCWVFGYFRHSSRNILFDKEAAEYALKLYSEKRLLEEAGNLNGSFALVLSDERGKCVHIISDRWGSIPKALSTAPCLEPHGSWIFL